MKNRSIKAEDIIDQEAQKWAEWLEMETNPAETLNRVLAHRIYLLEEEIHYLRKLNNVGNGKY